MTESDPERTSARHGVFADRLLWNVERVWWSLRLDVGRADHLAPLLGFVSDELPEIGGCTGKHRAAQVGKPRSHLGIGEARIDLRIEFVDDFGGRVLGRAYSIP